jgi:hypothetical protein
MTKDSKLKNLYLIILIILFLILNNFFYNFYYIAKQNYNSRMVYHYGFCDKSGYGFINFIYNKYKINENINIYNSTIAPNSQWFYYDSKNQINKSKLILLNYNSSNKNSDFIYLNLNSFKGNYKIIENEKNCYYLEKLND